MSKPILEAMAENAASVIPNDGAIGRNDVLVDDILAALRTTLAEHAGEAKEYAELIRDLAEDKRIDDEGPVAKQLENIADFIQLSTPSPEVTKLQERVKENNEVIDGYTKRFVEFHKAFAEAKDNNDAAQAAMKFLKGEPQLVAIATGEPR